MKKHSRTSIHRNHKQQQIICQKKKLKKLKASQEKHQAQTHRKKVLYFKFLKP